MSGNQPQSSFEKAIKSFTQNLRRRDVEDFRTTTLDQLKKYIAHLQAKQHAERRLQDLTRLQPFLEAIEQFGNVVWSLYPNSDVVSFIWGPLKFLLQAASINDTAFGEVLNAYEHLGEKLPLLLQHRNLFRIKPHMVLVLSLLYEGILNFQCIILRYFQQPLWQKVFSESWTTCKSRFSGILRGIAQHRSLIEGQATPAQIEETRENIQQSRQSQDNDFDEQNNRRFGEVCNWLRPADIKEDQAKFVAARAHYPETGQWLLENPVFKEWFHPQYATIPPLLWLNGMPGAGKTMLASLVVQEASMLKHEPAVLYFYCKHESPERNNFVALGRTLLAQLLYHDNELLPTFYQKLCRSGEAILSSPILLEELLSIAFGNCKKAYIVLDGLDECPREERKLITEWFRELVDTLPNQEADRLRCLFISQDDGFARKDFAGLSSVKINSEDTQRDVGVYCRVQADKLLESYPSLSRERVDWIVETVTNSVKGLFLLAKLIWDNLSNHTSLARLEEELEPNVFPKKLNDAYRRIMVRLDEQSLPAARDDALRLLGWLVCAKRSFKWHEIQVMNSINRDERCISFERQCFIKSPKDLLASLVEWRTDGTVEFCHSTVKIFLLEEGYVLPSKEELKLALLCIDYLNLPAFAHSATQAGIRNGDYGFVDYAVLFWLQHLEVGVTLSNDKEELMDELAESLEIFINQHWNLPPVEVNLAKRHTEKLQYFKALPFYNQLEQAVASTKHQLKSFGSIRVDENASNLRRIIFDVRRLLESTASNDSLNHDQEMIEARYGTNLFKCSRLSCQYFTIGFSSAAERNRHISKHERPFRCSDETCVGYTFGFSSTAEREKHMKENHFAVEIQDDEYPTQEDIERSIIHRRNENESSRISNPLSRDDSIGDDTTAASEEPVSESDSEVIPHYLPRPKRARQTEFRCPHCNTVYKKRYNLQSHLLSHESQRSHVCEVCQRGFARPTDLRRHMDTHTGTKSFVCSGFLRNGDPWGCGRSFARADTLNKHHESRVGRACIQPLLQEQETIDT